MSSRKRKYKNLTELNDVVSAEYDLRADPWREDTRIYEMKRAIAERLTAGERTVLLMYAELSSLRELAKLLGVSHQSVGKEIRNIKAKIKGEK